MNEAAANALDTITMAKALTKVCGTAALDEAEDKVEVKYSSVRAAGNLFLLVLAFIIILDYVTQSS